MNRFLYFVQNKIGSSGLHQFGFYVQGFVYYLEYFLSTFILASLILERLFLIENILDKKKFCFTDLMQVYSVNLS